MTQFPQQYEGGNYLDGIERRIPGSLSEGSQPIVLQKARDNVTSYDPEIVLAPDEITDACGRLAAFCLDGYPVWGYKPVEAVRVADLGTGSGNFLVSLIDGLQQPSDALVDIHAIDMDKDALITAQANISSKIASAPRPINITYDLNDYEQALEGLYDLIYFNPPYLEEGHDITHYEASLAPRTALYSNESTQEYKLIVPKLPEHLAEGGMAFIRLPRKDAKIDQWVYEQMFASMDIALLHVTTDQGREGRFLILRNGEYPLAIGEYDYFFNYLGGKEKHAQSLGDDVPFYHDDQSSFRLVRRKAAMNRLSKDKFETV